MIRFILFFTLIFIFLSQSVSGKSDLNMPEFVQRFFVDKGAIERKLGLKNTHEFVDRIDALIDSWEEKMHDLEYESLSTSEKIDYQLLRNRLQKERFFNEQLRGEIDQFASWFDFAEPLREFIVQRRRGGAVQPREIAALFHETKLQIAERTEQMENKPGFTSWQDAARAAEIADELRTHLEWAFDFYHLYNPDFSWWVEMPYKALNEKLEDYTEALKEHFDQSLQIDDGSGIFGRPIGSEALQEELRSEMIPYTAEELIELAWREFEWCQQQLKISAGKMGYDNYMDAIEAVKNTWVEPGDQPELINYFAEEAVEFLEKRDLMTIPDLAKETWRMRMLSPEMQRVAPFFLGGEQVQIAFPTSTMEHELKMMSLRGNNPHFSRAVVHHELIPGHHLQQFMTNRYNIHRRSFYTPFWIEGWALYWEMMLWEKDFARSPEDEIGMLFWRIHRNARIIFSLKFHLGEMSPAECIDFLVEKVGHERANAEAEVRRSFEGRWGPLYQISYMIGGLQMIALRNEIVETGLISEKEFHDRILHENFMPIELLRALLKDEAPPRDFESNWRFVEYLD